jgi:hypothetical protein
VNTIVFIIGFFSPDASQSMKYASDADSASVRRIFLTLRGLAILGSDVFAGVALSTNKVKYFWASFGFIAMSFTLSIVNSAVAPSNLSQLDLDMDIICFVIVLLLIREVYVYQSRKDKSDVEGVKKGHTFHHQFELRPPPYFAGTASTSSYERPPSTPTSFLQLSPQSLSQVPKLNKYVTSNEL